MKHGVIFSALLVGSALLLSACDNGGKTEVDANATKILDGKASIVMPEGFVRMPQEMLEARYPAEQRPQEAWYVESEGGKVAIVFNLTDNAISEAQVPKLAEIMKQQMSDFSPSISEVTVNGRKMSRLEMTTPTEEGNIYNLMQISSRDGKFLLSAFNTAEELKEKYAPAGQAALSSLKY
ncbi:hypothetical protein [Entomohabitans teleogrylli]|uniref:hypothetical protein n=1 Tax=Entomohabitans teleogrylli TaxID=1384589 RepID=UPI00073D4E9D|nr:hypothetical protein [Entomohabitans teleogrylli]